MDTFGRCNKCMAINWDSRLYMNAYGITGCRRCGCNETRWAGKVNLFERLYLLYWYFWETHRVNQEGQPDDPDPRWWLSPTAVLLTAWRGLHPDLSYVKKGDGDGHTQEPC